MRRFPSCCTFPIVIINIDDSLNIFIDDMRDYDKNNNDKKIIIKEINKMEQDIRCEMIRLQLLEMIKEKIDNIIKNDKLVEISKIRV